jgi:hypothetical protein
VHRTRLRLRGSDRLLLVWMTCLRPSLLGAGAAKVFAQTAR